MLAGVSWRKGSFWFLCFARSFFSLFVGEDTGKGKRVRAILPRPEGRGLPRVPVNKLRHDFRLGRVRPHAGGGKHGANYYLTGPDPVIAEDIREIVDTGSALPAPSYDENRELNDEEKALAVGCDALRKSKIRRMTFANSSEIDGEYFRELIYSELTGTYGLPADITVEIDPDMLEDLRAEFRDRFSGGSVSAEFEYTVKLPSGSYYDSYFKVLFFKS